ncbi:unnamed protein product [Paramecium sonneborni]|uniref:Uncharacterized protein n=1 Tax=Paramecium sonneborni TaxID=65129 RepID=A0A8S1PJR4_9CILI|nr:unnamed protein product [Paramecium sonneborni]
MMLNQTSLFLILQICKNYEILQKLRDLVIKVQNIWKSQVVALRSYQLKTRTMDLVIKNREIQNNQVEFQQRSQKALIDRMYTYKMEESYQ